MSCTVDNNHTRDGVHWCSCQSHHIIRKYSPSELSYLDFIELTLAMTQMLPAKGLKVMSILGSQSEYHFVCSINHLPE